MLPDIYFNSLAGGGKDTQAAYLVHRYGYTRLALADPLKTMACDMLHVHIMDMEARKKDYRNFLIGLGNGARSPWMKWVGWKWIPESLRRYAFEVWANKFGHKLDHDMIRYEFPLWAEGWGDPMYWLNRFKRAYDHHKHLSPDSPVVVTDCRYPNEGHVLSQWGLMGIRLKTSMEEVKARLFGRDGTTDFGFLTNSDSERLWEQVPVDFIVNGNAERDEVHRDVYAFLLHVQHARMIANTQWDVG